MSEVEFVGHTSPSCSRCKKTEGLWWWLDSPEYVCEDCAELAQEEAEYIARMEKIADALKVAADLIEEELDRAE